MLKDKVNHTKSGLNAFVDHMMEFVQQQDNELKRSVCRVGDLWLHSSYRHMEKSEEWLQMNISQRQDHFLALMKLPLQLSNPSVSDPVIELSEHYSSLLNKGIHTSKYVEESS